MTQRSWPWPGTTVGDAGTYSADEWDDMFEMRYGSGAAPYNNRGVIRNWANELEITDGGANTADMDTGAALVHGKHYDNDAVVNVFVASSVGAWREDLICLRSVWALQYVQVARHSNPADGVAYPAPTQTDGVTWEIPLAAVRINAAGAIIQITDLRDYVSDLMQSKQLQVMPKNIDGVDTIRSYHTGVRIDANNEQCGFEFMVPLDFKEVVSVFFRFIPYTTGSVAYSAWMRAGACGEISTAVQDSIIDAVMAVTNQFVECGDVTAAFDGLEAGDQVGFAVQNNAVVGDENILVVQLDFRYR